MHELVAETRIFMGRERLDHPVDQPRHACDPFSLRMIGQPNIYGFTKTKIEGNDLCPKPLRIGWESTDARTFCNRPIMRAADIGSERYDLGWRHPWKDAAVD